MRRHSFRNHWKFWGRLLCAWKCVTKCLTGGFILFPTKCSIVRDEPAHKWRTLLFSFLSMAKNFRNFISEFRTQRFLLLLFFFQWLYISHWDICRKCKKTKVRDQCSDCGKMLTDKRSLDPEPECLVSGCKIHSFGGPTLVFSLEDHLRCRS